MQMPIDKNTYMILFKIGPIQIPVYGFLLVFGFLIATLFSYIEWKKKKYNNWDFKNIFIMGGLISLYGSRWTYILFNPISSFQDVNSFLDVIMVFITINTGRTILGTVLFFPLFLYLYPKFFSPDVQWEDTFNIYLPNLFIAQSIGRWGNFADHSLYGNIVDENSLWWMTNFLKNNMYISDGLTIGYRNPLFFYESMTDLCFFLIFFGLKFSKNIKTGSLGALFLVFFGLIRISFEPFRDPSFKMMFFNIDIAIITSILIFLFGLILFIYIQWFHIYRKIVI